jgi:hypothetical protein
MADAEIDAWLAALANRHQAPFSPPHFLKAVRALSARYVERRAVLPGRSPLDSAGKRAAFAAFYAPLHLLATRAIVSAVRPPEVERVFDLGCGTGVAGAAWALLASRPLSISGIDRNSWALSEARWNWRQLGLDGDTRRGDLVREIEKLARSRWPERRGLRKSEAAAWERCGIVLGWSVNELSDEERTQLLPILLELGGRGATVVVIEPLARSAVPWWNDWTARWSAAGGRSAEWKLPLPLPPALAEIDRAAGFNRQQLSARSLYLSSCI